MRAGPRHSASAAASSFVEAAKWPRRSSLAPSVESRSKRSDIGARRFDVQSVAAGRRLDRVAGGGERLAEPHHVRLHRLGRARRRDRRPTSRRSAPQPSRLVRAGRRATPADVGAAARRRASAVRRTRPASSRAGTREVPWSERPCPSDSGSHARRQPSPRSQQRPVASRLHCSLARP